MSTYSKSEMREWLSESYEPKHFASYSQWRQGRTVNDEMQACEDYLDEWQAQLTSGARIISARHQSERLITAMVGRLRTTDRFGFHAATDFKAEIEGKLIYEIFVEESAEIRLCNCAIKKINCRSDSTVKLVLIDCWVDLFQVGPAALKFIEMRGGRVWRLESPLPNEKNPFRGSASIINVKFKPDIENAQAFRNMRHHLSEIHNQEAASVFHSAEMRTLYKQQNILDKIFNLIYRAISDYGNSTTRPLLLSCTFALLNFSIFFLTDGTVVPTSLKATGWQLALLNTGCAGDFLRSATITFTQIVNPLGMFGLNTLIIAKSTMLVISNMMLCLAATISLGFFVFALRRRFRLAQE